MHKWIITCATKSEHARFCGGAFRFESSETRSIAVKKAELLTEYAIRSERALQIDFKSIKEIEHHSVSRDIFIMHCCMYKYILAKPPRIYIEPKQDSGSYRFYLNFENEEDKTLYELHTA